jgi:hypothetical protein
MTQNKERAGRRPAHDYVLCHPRECGDPDLPTTSENVQSTVITIRYIMFIPI